MAEGEPCEKGSAGPAVAKLVRDAPAKRLERAKPAPALVRAPSGPYATAAAGPVNIPVQRARRRLLVAAAILSRLRYSRCVRRPSR